MKRTMWLAMLVIAVVAGLPGVGTAQKMTTIRVGDQGEHHLGFPVDQHAPVQPLHRRSYIVPARTRSAASAVRASCIREVT